MLVFGGVFLIAIQSFYPTPWFEAFPALVRFERMRAYQLWHEKQREAVPNKAHQSDRAKTAWDARWIICFYLCCDVSWFCMVLSCSMFAVLHWCAENLQCSKTFSEMFQDPFCPKKSQLESQTVSAFPAALHDPTSTSRAWQSHFLFAIWMMILLKAYWCKIVLRPLFIYSSIFIIPGIPVPKKHWTRRKTRTGFTTKASQQLSHNPIWGWRLLVQLRQVAQVSLQVFSCLTDCYAKFVCATTGLFSTLKLFEVLFVCALSILDLNLTCKKLTVRYAWNIH